MIDEIKWSELNFGKYRGKTLPEIATSDPDWYYSHFRRKLFPPPLDEQADLIAYQLDNIKPPRPDPDNWRFDYICDYEGYGKLLNMVLLRADEVVLPSPMNRQIMGHFSFLWPVTGLGTINPAANYWWGYSRCIILEAPELAKPNARHSSPIPKNSTGLDINCGGCAQTRPSCTNNACGGTCPA